MQTEYYANGPYVLTRDGRRVTVCSASGMLHIDGHMVQVQSAEAKAIEYAAWCNKQAEIND